MPVPSYLLDVYLRVPRVCTGSMKFITLSATPLQVIHAGQKCLKYVEISTLPSRCD